MKIKFLPLILLVTAFASCQTIYKSGQTPDDVYYSPARAAEEKAEATVRRDVVRPYDAEEREIRMSAYDPRWRNIDEYDYDYTYSPYQYGYSYGYYYNPYYYPCPVYITNVAILNPKNNTPRMTNLSSYSNTQTVVANQKTGATYNLNTYRNYNNSNRTNSRNIYNRTYSNDRTTSDNSSNSRSYTPSGSGSSSSSSSGGSSSGSVSRPSRGH